MVEEASSPASDGHAPGAKIDWRTGKPMVHHDDAFWHEHERRRVDLGIGIVQYCAANGLALSTYRHRISGKKRGDGKAARPSAAVSTSSPAFVAVAAPPSPPGASIEVALEGMTLRLCGVSAERVLARLMDRLG